MGKFLIVNSTNTSYFDYEDVNVAIKKRVEAPYQQCGSDADVRNHPRFFIKVRNIAGSQQDAVPEQYWGGGTAWQLLKNLGYPMVSSLSDLNSDISHAGSNDLAYGVILRNPSPSAAQFNYFAPAKGHELEISNSCPHELYIHIQNEKHEREGDFLNHGVHQGSVSFAYGKEFRVAPNSTQTIYYEHNQCSHVHFNLCGGWPEAPHIKQGIQGTTSDGKVTNVGYDIPDHCKSSGRSHLHGRPAEISKFWNSLENEQRATCSKAEPPSWCAGQGW